MEVKLEDLEAGRNAPCGGKKGGYLFDAAHNIQLDTPINNLLAVYGK